jgi:hypothetical protein
MASKPKLATIAKIVAARVGYPICENRGKKPHAETERMHLRGHIEVVPSAPVWVNYDSFDSLRPVSQSMTHCQTPAGS